VDIIDNRSKICPGKDGSEKIRLMNMKQVRPEVCRQLGHVRYACVPLPSTPRFGQWMNHNSLFLIGLCPLSLRKEMHLIAGSGQFTTRAVKHPDIIYKMTVTDMTNSHNASTFF